MGISGLLPLIKNATRPVKMKQFSGCTVAIDVYCWLHKGAFGCAEQLVQGKYTDAYIKYVMKYVNMLLYHNIKPILVFDGRNLPSKSETEKKRRQNRKENREKAVAFLREGKVREAREFFQRCVDITPAMARELIQACRERNIDCIVAPYEADAQLAFLNRTGIADIVITEDSDLTLFGCNKIIFKLMESGDGVLYEKEKLGAVFGLQADHFNFDKFKYMCIMSGCDYLSNLPGIGLGKSKTFWAKVTNPDLRSVLPKIPTYLNLPNVLVTQDYIQKFIQADNTFLYQLVFDPISRSQQPLTPYPPGLDPAALPYCGEYTEGDTACQLAMGNLDLNTFRQVTTFHPERNHLPGGQLPKYGTRTKHQSMWSSTYTPKSGASGPPLASSSGSWQPVSPQISSPAPPTRRKEVVVQAGGGGGRKQLAGGAAGPAKRKAVEVYSEEEVSHLLSAAEEDGDKSTSGGQATSTGSALLKRRRLEEGEERPERLRILGDDKLKPEVRMMSRYFGRDGERRPTPEEEAEREIEAVLTLVKQRRSITEPETSGEWFDSINSPVSASGRFIYRTEQDSPPSPVLRDISNRDTSLSPPTTTSTTTLTTTSTTTSSASSSNSAAAKLSIFAAKKRNPFALKADIFQTRSPGGEREKKVHQNAETNSLQVKGTGGTETAEPVRTEPVRAELVRAEPLRTEPVRTEPVVMKENEGEVKHHGHSQKQSPDIRPCPAPSAGLKTGTSNTVTKTIGSARPSGLSRRGRGGGKTGDAKQPTLYSLFAKMPKRAEI